MMIDTLTLVVLIICFIFFLVYVIFNSKRIPKRNTLLIITLFLFSISLLFFFTGLKKIDSDISRILRNSRPKTSQEVYSLLFKKPIGGCMKAINFKDQTIPKLDCCIWMELDLCPTELARIIKLKNYQLLVYHKSDSLSMLRPFSDKPIWWTPQNLKEPIIKMNVRFNVENEQTLFFGFDSSHVYLCDQAL